MKVKTPLLQKNTESNIPSARLKAVKRRSTVKVAIPGERFWVIVHSRTGNRFIGEVDNDLVTKSLKLGDIISFNVEHILDIDPDMVPEGILKARRKFVAVM